MTSRKKRLFAALDRHKELTPKNSLYRRAIEFFLHEMLSLDIGKGDLTTNLLFPDFKKISARIVAEDSGIFAGRQELDYFFKSSHPYVRGVKIQFFAKDGEKIREGTTLMELKGDIRIVAALERTLLNFLARMYGVATHTHKVVTLAKRFNPKIEIAATRKTIFSLLDKRAVYVGGGLTHRLNLSDAILIKDTHKDALSPLKNWKQIFTSIAKELAHASFLEVEVEHLGELLPIAEALAQYADRIPCLLMLDNMKPETVRLAIDLLHHEKLLKNLITEASGGITIKNLKQYAKTGVDVISMSALTQKAAAFNVRLDADERETPPVRRTFRR